MDIRCNNLDLVWKKFIVGGIKYVFKLFDNYMFCRFKVKFIG